MKWQNIWRAISHLGGWEKTYSQDSLCLEKNTSPKTMLLKTILPPTTKGQNGLEAHLRPKKEIIPEQLYN